MRHPCCVLAVVVAVASSAHSAHAQEAPYAFTYQGTLAQNNALVSGQFDLRFELLSDTGAVVTDLCVANVPVVDGLFSVVLDPGTIYPFTAQQQQSVRISVRPASGAGCQDAAGYTTLAPNQRIRPAPIASRATFAVQAASSHSLDGFPPSHFTNPANLAGTIPDNKLPANLPRSNTTNVFTGSNTFSQPLGIGASPTNGLLHIQGNQGSTTLTSNQAANGSVLTLENRTPSLTTGNYLGAINFGTSGNTPGQIGYVRGANVWEDTMQFRVGLLPGVAIDGFARLGVGTLVPQARLHVASSTSSITPNPNTMFLIDTAGTHYISSLITNSEESGLLFGRPAGGHAEAGVVYNNPATRGGLQLRTGGNQTRVFIGADGAVTVPGTISAGAVNYTAPKVGYKALGIGSFRSAGGGAALVGLSAERLSGNNFSVLGTTLELPHGATITNVSLICFDNDGAGDLAITLFETTFAGVFTPLRGTRTTGARLGYQTIDVTPAAPYVVDNANATIQLDVGMANLSGWSNALAIIGARVTYTTPAPD